VAPPLAAGGARPSSRRWLTAAFLLLLVLPSVELALIVAVGRTIGAWQTLALLLVESAFGAWLVRREGARAWTALTTALTTGRMPSRQLADAALVLVGGTLLLTPGFATDVVGFLVILPGSRVVARRWLEAVVRRRLLAGLFRGPGGRGSDGRDDGGGVVEGEVL
jgi:UPF0716 protein FxsA